MHYIKAVTVVARAYEKHPLPKTPCSAELHFKWANFPSSFTECSYDSIDRTFRRIPQKLHRDMQIFLSHPRRFDPRIAVSHFPDMGSRRSASLISYINGNK